MNNAESFFQKLLTQAVSVGASDIHFKMGLPPIVRVAGELKLLSSELKAMKSEDITAISTSIVPEAMTPRLDRGDELDLSYSLSGVGRFRVNMFRHRGQRAIICRFIPFKIQTIEELKLPLILKKIALLKRGLVLVTGAAGSGKSTTLAAMLNERNYKTGGHIVTIEDPTEYLIRDKKAVVTQREVGIDTDSFSSGLKHVLRQDPDVLMIGELRDRETAQVALQAAETGHLVLSTLHTNNAAESIQRLVGMFEGSQQEVVRMQFASVFSAVVCQRLIPSLEAKNKNHGRIPATEILVNTPRVYECMTSMTKFMQIYQVMEQGQNFGMHTFDQDLMRLFAAGKISKETATRFCSNPNNFELRLRGVRSNVDPFQGVSEKVENLTLSDGQVLELEDIQKKS